MALAGDFPRVHTPGEKILYPIDVSPLNTGDSLTLATATLTLVSGTDSNPAGGLSGGTIISGTVVGQWISGLVDGCVYLLSFSITTALGSTIKAGGHITCAKIV